MKQEVATAKTSYPSVNYWRSLRYYNLYRMVLASFFVFIAGVFGNTSLLGARDWNLFFSASELYALVVLLSFIPLRLRWPRFTWQLAGQVACDIVGLSVLSYASGGIESNIGLLLLVSLAAAGMISHGRITLFFAALASLGALLEHTYGVLYSGASTTQYVQVGLLCIAYFSVAWVAHVLANYAADSQLLAQRRGRDLAALSEANRLVMRDVQDGVLVVDDQGLLIQMNQSAARLLRNAVERGVALAEVSPIVYGQYMLWRQSGLNSADVLQLNAGVQARLRFLSIDSEAALGAVVFLEDMQRVRIEAQQIKLAALGRLTANIAHEVRNPLSAISYAGELLAEEDASVAQRRLLKIVMDNTQRINQIVQDVMQLNRRDRAHAERFNLGERLQAFAEEFILTEQLDAGVLAAAGELDVEVSFDRGHFRQILSNLCGNSLRYGSGQPGSMRLSVSNQDGSVLLDISDDGSGVAAEHQGKLFEPFFTLSANGSGLGLYIAKELCEANNASLEYCAEMTAGACFRITFGGFDEQER